MPEPERGPGRVALTRWMKQKKATIRRGADIHCLPEEVVISVLAKVGSSSLDDLYSAKLSCKDFNKLGQDKHVFQLLSITRVPLIPWTQTHKVSKFLKRCRESGNAEALYRQGMRQLFTGKRPMQIGLRRLKEAAAKGHAEATYVYGAILVCFGGDADVDLKQQQGQDQCQCQCQSQNQGLQLLYSLDRHKTAEGERLNIAECRERIKKFIYNLWLDKDVVATIIESRHNGGGVIKRCSDCGNRQDIFTSVGGWDFDEHDKFSSCDSCRWHQEVNVFCDILRPNRRYL